MHRKPFVFVLVVLASVLLASCASSGRDSEPVAKAVKGTEESPFVKQFVDAGASIQVNEGFISLKKDFHLPSSATLVLNTGEIWNLNLNGHTIFRDKGDSKPAIVIEKGSLAIVTGRSEKYQGGVHSSDGICIQVKKGGTLDIQAGTIDGGSYAIEVMEGGILKVRDGRIQAEKMPLHVQFGWIGNFTGGLFSAYHDSYAQAILGENFASVRFLEQDRDFGRKWPGGFRVVQGQKYSGLSCLKINSTGGYSAYYRLYREQDVDDVNRIEDPVPAYEWFMYPGQVQTKELLAGRYILKVAEGYEWSDENAFGDNGIYWNLEPFYFEDGKVYVIERQNGTVDSKDGFLNP